MKQSFIVCFVILCAVAVSEACRSSHGWRRLRVKQTHPSESPNQGRGMKSPFSGIRIYRSIPKRRPSRKVCRFPDECRADCREDEYNNGRRNCHRGMWCCKKRYNLFGYQP